MSEWRRKEAAEASARHPRVAAKGYLKLTAKIRALVSLALAKCPIETLGVARRSITPSSC